MNTNFELDNSEAVVRFRTRMRLTQKDLASLIGKSASLLNKLENDALQPQVASELLSQLNALVQTPVQCLNQHQINRFHSGGLTSYCPECGARTDSTCPVCKQSTLCTDHFCSHCGERLYR
jgi:DNA-binding XRE family transcriptional regulator